MPNDTQLTLMLSTRTVAHSWQTENSVLYNPMLGGGLWLPTQRFSMSPGLESCRANRLLRRYAAWGTLTHAICGPGPLSSSSRCGQFVGAVEIPRSPRRAVCEGLEDPEPCLSFGTDGEAAASFAACASTGSHLTYDCDGSPKYSVLAQRNGYPCIVASLRAPTTVSGQPLHRERPHPPCTYQR
jgi:hypothetical protein